MADIWFSADLHLDHKKILVLGNGRPYSSYEEMNEVLLENINAYVKPGDTFYFLGDFAFATPNRIKVLLNKMPVKLDYVWGNHDRHLEKLKERVSSFSYYKEIRIGNQLVVLSHFPFLEWNQAYHGSWHLHGHQHGTGHPTNKPRLDIGVDCFGFRPVNYDEVAEIMKWRSWEPS